jgi:NAD(P)-dependent dehydrogenase (short-subunit alcohol dehydrogenase family)
MTNNYTLIIGATSAVGIEISRTLKARGKSLILHGSNKVKLKSLLDEFPGDLVWDYDLRHIDDMGSALEVFLKNNGCCVDSFIHSAGIYVPLTIKSLTAKKISESYSINVFSSMIAVKTLMTYSINKKNLNNVILVSSNISGFGGRATSIYGSSKAALDGFMKSCAIELAPQVRVNSVLPGAMLTPMTEKMLSNSDVLSSFERQYPMGLSKPIHVAKLVDYLLSEAAEFLSGQMITIDGGRCINMSV